MTFILFALLLFLFFLSLSLSFHINFDAFALDYFIDVNFISSDSFFSLLSLFIHFTKACHIRKLVYITFQPVLCINRFSWNFSFFLLFLDFRCWLDAPQQSIHHTSKKKHKMKIRKNQKCNEIDESK